MGQVKKEDFCVFCREVKPYSVVKKNIRKRRGYSISPWQGRRIG